MKSNLGYIIMFHNDFIRLDISNPFTSLDSPVHLNDDDETHLDNTLIWEP